MKTISKFLLASAALALSAGSANAAVITYSGSGGAINDLSSFVTTITVPDTFVVTDVNVTLDGLTHTFWNDLRFVLNHGATSVTLIDNSGGGSDPNGSFTFDDAASTPSTAINTAGGLFSPLQSLSAFNGASSAGTWNLSVIDEVGADAGRLTGWTLSLDGYDRGAVPEPATWAMMLAGFGLVGAAMRRKQHARVRFAI